MKKTYSDEELLMRVLARDSAVDIMNLRVYLNANEEREKELDTLWVKKPENLKTASYGKNWGYYCGMDSIRSYYITKHKADMQKYLDDYCLTRPMVSNSPENLGRGYSSIAPISAPSVQVAEDLQSVKALFYSVGYQNVPLSDGTIRARWIAQKVAADLILEDGEYKIWHLLEISDSSWRPGVDYHEEMPVFETEDDILRLEFGKPDIEVLTHDRQFCWADNYPAMPEPYDTMTDDLSWGPEGYRPFIPSVRAKEIILVEPKEKLGFSSAGKNNIQEAE